MSSQQIRFFGKKKELPTPSGDWAFERRPGGLVIASKTETDGRVRRLRFALHQEKKKFWFKTQLRSLFGERVIGSKSRGDSAEDAGDLMSQFPGKVRKISVKVNQKVKKGDTLLLLEAMKMEFVIKAPFNGKVTKVYVSEMQQVLPGAQFIDLERETDRND